MIVQLPGNGPYVAVFNTHIVNTYEQPTTSNGRYKAVAQRIANSYKVGSTPFRRKIVMGDFNADIRNYPYVQYSPARTYPQNWFGQWLMRHFDGSPGSILGLKDVDADTPTPTNFAWTDPSGLDLNQRKALANLDWPRSPASGGGAKHDYIFAPGHWADPAEYVPPTDQASVWSDHLPLRAVVRVPRNA